MIEIPTWGDRRHIRIGLYGGSFNPFHKGHLKLAKMALTQLQLDQVWLMVSPGNPLKRGSFMAPFGERYQRVKQNTDARRLIATDIEKRLGTRYSCDTIEILQTRFPRSHFVWLMGADSLAQMALWSHWKEIVRLVPMVIFPRPSYIFPALKGKAACCLKKARYPDRYAPVIANMKAPAWIFMQTPQTNISATALRNQDMTSDKSFELKKD